MPHDNRAYAPVELKSLGGDERRFSGIASTPTLDRDGDIIVPTGAVFDAKSIPILLDHNSSQAVGEIESLSVTRRGIRFEARIANIEESGPLKDMVDGAWQMIKNGLRKAVSVGFRVLPDGAERMDNGGLRISAWELLELSLVAIPANAEARILSAKSATDQAKQIRLISKASAAASGIALPKPSPKAAPGTRTPVKIQLTKGTEAMPKSIADQIADYTATIEVKEARKLEMMEKSAESGETFSDEEAEEFDTLTQEVAQVKEHIARLETLAEIQQKSATEVKDVKSPDAGKSARNPVAAKAKAPDLPKGTGFTRYVLCLAKSRGNLLQAAEIAKNYDDSTPEVGRVLKAAVAAGTTTDPTWAAPLAEYTNLASEFIELLRPATILGRISGFRQVPFNVKIPGAASGTSVNWVGQGAPKPVSAMAFNTTSLGHFKAAGIVVLTDELIRMSNPSAEALVRQDLIDSMAQFLDAQLLDPAIAEVPNVSPAAITNGVTAVAASGTSADALRTDVRAVFNNFIAANLSMAGAHWIMSPTQALAISMMQNPLGQPEFAGLTMEGGTFMGLPAVLSENVPSGQITLVKAPEVFLADDGEVLLDASREASLQMDDAPAAGAQAMVSMFQSNMVAIRAERYVNWKTRRAQAVQMITGAAYV